MKYIIHAAINVTNTAIPNIAKGPSLLSKTGFINSIIASLQTRAAIKLNAPVTKVSI